MDKHGALICEIESVSVVQQPDAADCCQLRSQVLAKWRIPAYEIRLHAESA
ncbi:hypothetical protein BANRA_00065 [Escherichia coli]|nr:hypothetical protein BANRA_00065 [Escherichia coli]